MEVFYTPAFIRQFKKLELDLQKEVTEKITLFKQIHSRSNLKVHKLHGRFSDCWSFSVNYKTRIVFQSLSKKKVALLAVGDHAVYDV
jgi:addiction module RelE/StbE family toxin